MSKVLNMSGGGAQEAPTITVSSSGLITAKAGDETATKQLSTQAAQTIMPGTSSQTAVASGRYTTGAITVAGDSNLVAEHIEKGWSIFGVAGTKATPTVVDGCEPIDNDPEDDYFVLSCPGITSSSTIIGMSGVAKNENWLFSIRFKNGMCLYDWYEYDSYYNRSYVYAPRGGCGPEVGTDTIKIGISDFNQRGMDWDVSVVFI